jgi:hypothetical protein
MMLQQYGATVHTAVSILFLSDVFGEWLNNFKRHLATEMPKTKLYAGFEALTAVVLKNTVF